MLLKEYEKQFNVHPANDLETYCKLEGVSMFSIRKRNSSKADAKKLENVRVVMGDRIIKLGYRIKGIPSSGTVG